MAGRGLAGQQTAAAEEQGTGRIRRFGAVIRLLECLTSPLDSRILGRQMVREIAYRVLLGEQGGGWHWLLVNQ